jgi:AraC family transcriptional regulator
VAHEDAYARRFERLLRYIDEHVDDDLSVEVLSRVAGLSRFHFQRQFSRLFGLTVRAYVELVRMRRASTQLAFRDDRILDVALDAGYGSHEAFTRAFARALGHAPSEFRAAPDWDVWFRASDRLRAIRAEPAMRLDGGAVQVERLPATRVAVVEHRGDPRGLPDTIRQFIAWRRGAGIPSTAATYNRVYDDPDAVEPVAFRFDLCVAIERQPAAGAQEVELPATRAAVVRHVGTEDGLWRTVGALYGAWLPASGHTLGPFPLLLRRVAFFPDVQESDAVTEIALPLAG